MENFEGLSRQDIKLYKEACDEVKGLLVGLLIRFCLSNNIDFLISSRIKEEESINKKIKNKGNNNINDIVGIRIVFCELGKGVLSNPQDKISRLTKLDEEIANYTPNEFTSKYILESKSEINGNDEYIFLFIEYLIDKGIIINREKDYVSEPKISGYQSFHFVIKAPNGKKVEVQIRNYLQHLFAEWEHTFYKTMNEGYSMDDLVELLIVDNSKGVQLVKKNSI